MTPDEFVETLDDWTMRGGEFPSDKIDRHYLTTVAEAEAVVRALANGDLMYCGKNSIGPNLRQVANLLYPIRSPAVENVMRKHAVPHLCELIAQGFAEDFTAINSESMDPAIWALQERADTYFTSLRIAAYFGDPLINPLLIQAARIPYYEHKPDWSTILDYVASKNSRAVEVLEALRSPLPNQFSRIAYLDFANHLAFDQRIKSHPFDTDQGCEFLLTKFAYDDPGYDSYAISAIAAASFLSVARCKRLLAAAHAHTRKILHREAAWAEARANYPGGAEFLDTAALKPQTATRAVRYLKAMGLGVPSPANPAEFAALQKASDWLSREQDFYNQGPDELFVVDHRLLRLPPSGETRPAWLIGYRVDLEEEHHEGFVTICGEAINRYFPDQDIRLNEAYADIARYDRTTREHYESLAKEEGFWPKLIAEFNPGLSR